MLTPAAPPRPGVRRPVARRDLRRLDARRPRRAAQLLHGATRAGPKRGYYYQLAAMAGWTSLPFLSLLRQPTLVLGGDDDPIIPLANARMLARLIPDARLHVYRGGHLGILTESDELAPVIEDFLTEELHQP